MSNLNVNFENLTEEEKAQLLAIVEKSQTKKDSIEFKLEERFYFVNVKGDVIETKFLSDIEIDVYVDLKSFGNLYRTREQAEIAAKAMRRFNRILQFAILQGGYREFVGGEENWFVYLDTRRSVPKWYAGTIHNHNDPATVCMTKKCAELLCDKLNSGEYSL